MPRSSSTDASAPLASWIRCALLTGIVVGITDYAIGFGIFVAWLGRPLLGVFQAPAAALLGMAAFRGGLATAAIGTTLHFAIAIAWAFVFVFTYRTAAQLRSITSKWFGLFAVGTATGVLVWIVMNNVLAPLSRGRPEPFGTSTFWAVLLGHILFVGIPMVWATRRFAPNEISDDPSTLRGSLS